jgi:hypothetical protein
MKGKYATYSIFFVEFENGAAVVKKIFFGLWLSVDDYRTM